MRGNAYMDGNKFSLDLQWSLMCIQRGEKKSDKRKQKREKKEKIKGWDKIRKETKAKEMKTCKRVKRTEKKGNERIGQNQ